MEERGSNWSSPGAEQTLVPGKKRDICALRDHKSLWRKGGLGMCSSLFDCPKPICPSERLWISKSKISGHWRARGAVQPNHGLKCPVPWAFAKA